MPTQMIIKRNAKEDKGKYGYSVHEPENGGAANVLYLKDNGELQKMLLDFGFTEDYAKDLIDRLEKDHPSVKIDISKKTIPG